MKWLVSVLAMLQLLLSSSAFSPRQGATTVKLDHQQTDLRPPVAFLPRQPSTFAIIEHKNYFRQDTVLRAAAGVDSKGPVKIIIAGAPASGKGTQCEQIKEKFGVVHLSTGDMLRAAVAAGTDVGKEAKSYMDSGQLVPDSTIIGVVR